MNGKFPRSMVVLVMLIALLSSLNIAAVPRGRLTPVIMSFTATLQPGVWHGWAVRPSSAQGGYIVEVTPLKSAPDGSYVQKALVQPEYDGSTWNDVLRVMIPEWMPPLEVSIRVYDAGLLPVVSEFDALLEPGVWHGFSIGAAGDNRAYIAEISPLDPSEDGACIEKLVIQPEFPGEWIDVLRVQIPAWLAEGLNVRVRIYETSALPVVSEFETTLAPGDWQGHIIQASRLRQGLVAEVTPLDDLDGWVDQIVIQPEYNGKTWNDVLRLSVPAVREESVRVSVRVYGTSGRGKHSR